MRGRAQETISPKPAIPPLFPGVEQVQEFLVLIWLVDAGFNPPISLPAPALNRPQEICRYALSFLRWGRKMWMAWFSKVPGCGQWGLGGACCAQHCSGWGHKGYSPKSQQGAGDGSRAIATSLPSGSALKALPFCACIGIFEQASILPGLGVCSRSPLPKFLSKTVALNKHEITGRALGRTKISPFPLVAHKPLARMDGGWEGATSRASAALLPQAQCQKMASAS